MNIVDFRMFSGSTCAQQFAQAAEYLEKHPHTKLIIPPGNYILSYERAKQLQKDIMNGKLGENPESQLFLPNTPYDIGFSLLGAEDVEIEAYGVTLLLDGFMEGINIQNCRNVVVRGIHMDLMRKAYSRGKIINTGENYTDVDFENLSLISDKMPSNRIAVINQESGRIEKITGTDKREFLEDGKIRFYNFSYPEYIGCDIYVWHSCHYRPCIHIYNSDNTVLEDVSIFNNSGMGIVGFQSKDIFLKNVKVVPSCGESISTNTDATHFASCRGKLEITDCSFEGHGDDAVNVHGYYYDVALMSDSKYRLSLNSQVMTHSCKLDYPMPGDILELSRKSEIIPLDCFTVKSVIPHEADWCCYVELDRKLPDAVEEYYLANQSATPSFLFRNCEVKNNIARGILIKTHNVLIENCTFDHNTGTAIHVGAEADWREGLISNNVVIRNNKITGSGYQGWGRILDAGGISVNILSQHPYSPAHKNIIIENNKIDVPSTKHAIYAGNIDGLVIRENSLSSMEETICMQCCVNVNIENNQEISY